MLRMKLLEAPPNVRNGKRVMITTRVIAVAKDVPTTALNLCVTWRHRTSSPNGRENTNTTKSTMAYSCNNCALFGGFRPSISPS